MKEEGLVILSSWKNFDLFEYLLRSCEKIPEKWRRSFYILSAINFAVFVYTIVNQPLGNHDILYMPWMNPWDQFQAGRWFATALFVFFGHATLPVVAYAIAVCLNVLAAMAACILWKKDDSVTWIVLLGLIVTIIPSANFYYYYRYDPYVFTGSNVLMISGLIIASRNSISRILLGAVCITLGFATYQVAVNVLATVFALYVFFETLSAECRVSTLARLCIQNFFPKLMACVGGAAMYYGSLAVLREGGWLKGLGYQLETNSAADLPERISEIYVSLVNEFTQSQAFMPLHVKYALGLVVASALFMVVWRSLVQGKSLREKLLKPLLLTAIFVGALFSTKVMFLVSAAGQFNAFKWGGSLAFFFMACASILIASKSVLVKNASYGVILFLLVNFAWNSLVWQEIWVRSNEHDRAVLNRILGRIESLPEIDYTKQYDYIQIGEYPSFQAKLYRKWGHRYEIGPGSQFFQRITLPDITSDFYELLGARIQMRNLLRNSPNYLEKLEKVIAYAEGSLQIAQCFELLVPFEHINDGVIHHECGLCDPQEL